MSLSSKFPLIKTIAEISAAFTLGFLLIRAAHPFAASTPPADSVPSVLPNSREETTSNATANSGNHDGYPPNAHQPSVYQIAEHPITYARLRFAENLLTRDEYHRQVIELFLKSPVPLLARICRDSRDATRKQDEDGILYDIHEIYLQRAPWRAVGELLADLDWERRVMGSSDSDVDLENDVGATMTRLAREDPDRIAEALKNIEQPMLMELLFADRAFEPKENRLQFIDAAMQSPAGRKLRGFFIDLRFRELAKSDPDDAKLQIEALRSESERTVAAKAMLSASSEPKALLREFNDAGILADDLITMLDYDPERAVQQASKLPVSSSSRDLRDRMMNSIFETNPELAAILASQDDGGGVGNLESLQAEHSTSATDEDLERILGNHTRISSNRAVSRWLKNRGPNAYVEAAEIISGIAPTRNHTELLAGFAYLWADTSPAAAAKWVAQLEAPGFQHRASQRVMANWSGSDPEAALRWAASIDSIQLRQKLAMTGLRELAAEIPALARQYQQQFDLSARDAAEISRIIEDHE